MADQHYGRLSNHRTKFWTRPAPCTPAPSPCSVSSSIDTYTTFIPLSPTSKMSQPNGTADAPIEVSSIPTVVGINFGNSYASISVLTKVRATSIVLASEVNRRTGRDGGLHRQRGWRTSDCLRDCVSRRGAGEWRLMVCWFCIVLHTARRLGQHLVVIFACMANKALLFAIVTVDQPVSMAKFVT